MKISENPGENKVEKKVSEIISGLDNEIRRDILNFISEKGSASFTELMHTTGMETSKLAFHLKKMGLLLEQDPEKRYSLSEEGGIAVEILEHGRGRIKKGRAALPDETLKIREHPSIFKRAVLSVLAVRKKKRTIYLVGLVIISLFLMGAWSPITQKGGEVQIPGGGDVKVSGKENMNIVTDEVEGLSEIIPEGWTVTISGDKIKRADIVREEVCDREILQVRESGGHREEEIIYMTVHPTVVVTFEDRWSDERAEENFKCFEEWRKNPVGGAPCIAISYSTKKYTIFVAIDEFCGNETREINEILTDHFMKFK